MSRLTLSYRHDSSFWDKRLERDDFGVLSFDVRTNDFSGQGSDWVQWQDLKELGQKLSVFPIVEPVIEEWGDSWEDSFEVILGLSISPANSTGDLRVAVEITDSSERWRGVRTSFLTNYPDVEAFARAVVLVADGKVEEAVLRGR